ncbi:MAG TPA: aromatic ring-hydroxylating dioxygenase subunit alpha [Planctomycetaceae bacterium]|nr:aromatic ring-hydroxylating dioxygenase subunit alpha [Planctomycetaceae bacterium]
MFISDTHLPQVLQPGHYSSPEILRREIDALFARGWHCLAVLPEFPREGDYRTLEFAGRPLILWRQGGAIHAFLNVCTHRFSQLRSHSCGHAGTHLKCQYHGWEYDADGNTCRIPDAQCFRPMEKGLLGLTKFRTELLGQLVFVSLDPDGPSLREYLGAFYDLLAPEFTADRYLIWKTVLRQRCNWKIPMENTVESYHTAQVHPNSFGMYPEERFCTHEIHAERDMMQVDYSYQTNRGERLVSRLLGCTPDFVFRHCARYPDTVVSLNQLFTTVWTVVPDTPDTCRELIWTFALPGRRGRVRSWIAGKLLKWWVTKFSEQVRAEDAAIFPHVQRGISVPERPIGGGLISRREERIFAFQNFVAAALGEPSPGHRPDAATNGQRLERPAGRVAAGSA